ncbi:hypothetical protein BHE97_08305 [Aeromicrobium sp. PE09-221]|uniref:helix-turn-helix transcriptional regulator n=1 Tax=Aeromicrobium sp. PE09-221 TaxID=1898043 RepID=UPI000B6D522E|nr:helix-turn-helix domain-containing protein [Aeromicrobium sp. PE09-221]OUZ10333.1 hypothetical protein BHE97_08305 [Aeromicrobium sp. PE09-221]
MGPRQRRALGSSTIGTVSGSFVHEDADELAVVIEGSATMRCDDSYFELNPHIALWIPAGTDHHVTLHDGSLVSPIGLTRPRDVHAGWSSLAELRVTARLRALAIQDLQHHISDLYLGNGQVRDGYFGPNPAKTRIVELLPALERDGLILRMPQHSAAARIARTLREHPADQRSLEELSKEVFVSAKTVQRAFSSETGLSFSAWRMRARMRVALSLLCRHEQVEVVARRVGYQSVAGFVLAYRREIGFDPQETASRANLAPTGSDPAAQRESPRSS